MCCCCLKGREWGNLGVREGREKSSFPSLLARPNSPLPLPFEKLRGMLGASDVRPSHRAQKPDFRRYVTGSKDRA